jgi:hypothetical protein
MTYGEIMAMMDETGLPFAYDHFAEGESPDPPFLVFLLPRSDNFNADNRVYQKIAELRVELYTDRKQPDVEFLVEGILDGYDLNYEKEEIWIAEERLYENIYTMEMIYNEQ